MISNPERMAPEMDPDPKIMSGPPGTVTLWRPTGQSELDLVAKSGWKKWPPRLPDQPIFYPVLNRAYATRIAREWNVPERGAGFVTCFEVQKTFLDRYEVHQVGGKEILEYWIPASDLNSFNAQIVGAIRTISEFRPPVTTSELESAEDALGFPIPEEWKSFLRQTSWLKSGWLSDECYLKFYSPAESVEVARAWEPSTSNHPGIFFLGDDGASERLVLSLREAAPRVFAVNNVSGGWEEAVEQTESVRRFIDRVEANTFMFK